MRQTEFLHKTAPNRERELLLYQAHQLLFLLREKHKMLQKRMRLAKLGQTNLPCF